MSDSATLKALDAKKGELPFRVQLNGPKGTGKTTFAKKLVTRLSELGYVTELFSYKSPLRAMLFAFAEDFDGTRYVEPFAEIDEAAYDMLKQRDFGGFTGRDLQIMWGTGMRSRQPDILCQIAAEKILSAAECRDLGVAVIDDMGFENEYYYGVTSFDNCIIYLDERDGVGMYSHGEKFNGDSRICLRGHADLINPSVEEAVEHLRVLL